ncbi:IscS subfamily cysteine desulfurase [Anaplasmataceae bacterium AB001_6]|nr:IscS subfamily cysteine desulfurase [Anaplasmataceae bacterium AB001_6]
MIKLVYLDNNATTQTDPRVLEEMSSFFLKPSNMHSRSHNFGWSAEEAVDNAKDNIAKLIGSSGKDIILTSGATEANNLAILGAVEFYKIKHVITLQTEHKCVLECCRKLERMGVEVTYLRVQSNGLIDIKDLKEAIKSETKLISVMFANNEIGVIQPMKEIGKICKDNDIIFHVDAAQAYGKIKIDVNDMNISLLSISSHKIYGPMGIGALYVSRKPVRIRLSPIIIGGGQERGMRSGTVPTPLAVGFGKAAEICAEFMEEESKRCLSLRNRLRDIICEGIPSATVNGDMISRLPGNLNISFPYVEGESIIMSIDDIAVSSGSACTSASLEPSYVLRALGLDDIMAHSSIRFGIGRFNTIDEIEYTGQKIVKQIKRLMDLSPLWEMVQEGIDLSKVEWVEH